MTTHPKMSRRDLLAALAALPLLASSARGAAESLPRVTVSKDPSCGCCGAWADHVRAAGFPVEVVERSDLNQLKAELGVPSALASCHTAQVEGYVIEGHVPAEAIKRLLAEKPPAKGLAVPGMPVGAPGMEVPGRPSDTYEVVLFGPGGRKAFARYNGARAL